jgi:hypothetical protein
MEKESKQKLPFWVFKPCSICGKETRYDAMLSIENWIEDIEDEPICVDCLIKKESQNKDLC